MHFLLTSGPRVLVGAPGPVSWVFQKAGCVLPRQCWGERTWPGHTPSLGQKGAAWRSGVGIPAGLAVCALSCLLESLEFSVVSSFLWLGSVEGRGEAWGGAEVFLAWGGGWFEECAPEQVRMQAGTAVAELQPGERPAIAPPGPVAQLTCSVRDLSCQKGSPLLSRGSCPHRNGGCFSPGRKPLVPPHTHTARRLPLVAEEAGPGNYSAPPAWKRNS